LGGREGRTKGPDTAAKLAPTPIGFHYHEEHLTETLVRQTNVINAPAQAGSPGWGNGRGG